MSTMLNLVRQFEQYTIERRAVGSVDNQGEPCEVCQDVDAVVEANVYGVVVGEHASLYECVDCCSGCVPAVTLTMDPTADVTVEFVETEVDDRMHGQDCTCAHPDAL